MENWVLADYIDFDMSDIQIARSLLPSQVKLEIDDCLESDVDQEDRVPFSESTNFQKNSESERMSKLIKTKSKENKDSPKRVCSPRLKRQSFKHEELNTSIDRSVSPTPESDDIQAPLTPTANLKMLFSAMSPEIRNRDKRKELFHEEPVEEKNKSVQVDELEIDDDSSRNQDFEEDGWKPRSRKEKSLGLLCQKFLQKYPEFPGPNENSEISLDEVAKELAVERRRIYDIVNVLESVEIVSRIAKNKYAWHGKTNLVNTLGKLKALGEAEGFDQQLKNVKDYELNRELDEQLKNNLDCTQKEKANSPTNSQIGGTALLRKDKSLGIMSQKFLMLFLVSQPKTVNLDLAAKILIGDPNVDRTENAKFKTKIRRLYDIANILTSLDLIRKVHVTEIRGRKPAFKYIGPIIDNMKDISVCYNDGYHRPSSRHSLLDCVKNQHVAELMCPYKPIQPCGQQNFSSDGEHSTASTPSPENPGVKKSSFKRNCSFEQICEVAEKERHKLYASMSQPSSPTFEKLDDDFPKSLSQEEPSQSMKRLNKPKGKHIILQQKNGQFQIVNSDSTGPAVTHKLPVQPVTKKMLSVAVPKEQTKDTTSSNKAVGETVVVKTSQISQKQATMIPLTKDQIDAVLKSLKVPVPIKKNLKKPGEFQEIVDKADSTKGSAREKPKTIVCSMETVMCSLDSANNNKRPNDDPNPEPSKKIRIEFSSPPPDNNVANPKSNSDSSSESTSPVQGSHVKNIGTVGNVQQIAVQLPNQSPTILQFPVVALPQDSEGTSTPPNHSQSVVSNLGQQMQIIQGVPLSASGVQGQPINFMVPVTFSPPLTPQSGSSSPIMFSSSSYPVAHPQCSFSTVEQLQSINVASKLTSPVPVTNPSLLTPTERPSQSSASHLITPTERPVSSTSNFYGYTPGGFLTTSPSVSVMPTVTKEITCSTARKLDLPDITTVNC